uniref:Uncharacterized protein n=1 Tax=Haptolina ericina TaxID=156174 RepID=A0A7S3B3Z8_9EUKA
MALNSTGEDASPRIACSTQLPRQCNCLPHLTMALQQHPEVVCRDQRVGVLISQRRSTPRHRLEIQRRSAGQIALGLQQPPEVVDRVQRVWVLITQRHATNRQRLAIQRRRPSQITLGLQQQPDVVD